MAVFEDLWAKGLCAVSGSNYGADYVVYDGKSQGGYFLEGVVDALRSQRGAIHEIFTQI